jgi:hypothetical protein
MVYTCTAEYDNKHTCMKPTASRIVNAVIEIHFLNISTWSVSFIVRYS